MLAIIKMFLLLAGAVIWEEAWKRIERPALEMLATIGTIFILWSWISPAFFHRYYLAGSALMTDLFQILVIIITLYFMGYVKLQICDYVFLTGVLFAIFEQGYFIGCEMAILMLATWTLYLWLIRRRYASADSMMVSAFVSVLAALVSDGIYLYLYQLGFRQIYYRLMHFYDWGRFEKMIVLTLTLVVFLLVIAFIIFVVNRSLGLLLEKSQKFGRDYQEVGRYLMAVPFVVAVVFGIIELIVQRYYLSDTGFYYLISGLFLFVVVATQVFYLKMLLNTVQLKEKMSYQEVMQMNLMEYNRKVEENIEEIRAMKHDMKNVFLTMGEYVARSEDQQMKDYYYTNIAPFATNEIRMNDIYIALQGLSNESLKAFLYYKIMQAMDHKVEMRLTTQLDHSYFPYLIQSTDYTRMLGVFIDNAVEEVEQLQKEHLQNGQQESCEVLIQIIEREGKMSISVRNPVRPRVREQGIISGTTSKGLGRGNGLLNVEKIVRRHSDILWNSYFKDNEYIQTIMAQTKTK